jgi:hypothetical protein
MKKTILVALLSIFIFACKKYEEGPMFSLRSKEERLANTWKVKQYFENGVDKTKDFLDEFKNFVMNISKNNTYTLSYDDSYYDDKYSESGTWYFNTGKTSVIFIDDDNCASTWKILKLKEKEFWAEIIEDDMKIEIRLISS